MAKIEKQKASFHQRSTESPLIIDSFGETQSSSHLADEPEAGPECPTCSCRHLPVLYTRHRDKQTIRVRQCRNCGRRILTRESIN